MSPPHGALLQARQLAHNVLQRGGSSVLQAEATTIQARALHALGQMQDANRCYHQVPWLLASANASHVVSCCVLLSEQLGCCYTLCVTSASGLSAGPQAATA